MFLDLYRDRLEVINPGGLYGTVTISTMQSALGGSSRNMRLATLLESTPTEFGYVAENRGTGYRAIVRELSLAGMPEPRPEDLVSYFKLVVRARRDSVESAGLGQRPNASGATAALVPRGDAQRKIVEYVTSVGSASISELAARAGVSRSTMAKRVARLVGQGVLLPTEPGSSPRQRYRVG